MGENSERYCTCLFLVKVFNVLLYDGVKNIAMLRKVLQKDGNGHWLSPPQLQFILSLGEKIDVMKPRTTVDDSVGNQYYVE
jgi:hypothetical protein